MALYRIGIDGVTVPVQRPATRGGESARNSGTYIVTSGERQRIPTNRQSTLFTVSAFSPRGVVIGALLRTGWTDRSRGIDVDIRVMTAAIERPNLPES